MGLTINPIQRIIWNSLKKYEHSYIEYVSRDSKMAYSKKELFQMAFHYLDTKTDRKVGHLSLPFFTFFDEVINRIS